MKYSNVPFGFEEFCLEELGDNLSHENLKNGNKDLVLISAPAYFDVDVLKDKQFIINGSKPLICEESGDQESVLRWDLHASSAGSDQHLNILLPSQMTDHHVIAPNFTLNLSVVRTIQIPVVKSSKKKKTPSKQLASCNLRERWIPFGSEYPLHGNDNTSSFKELEPDWYNPSFDELSSSVQEMPIGKKKGKRKNKSNGSSENVNESRKKTVLNFHVIKKEVINEIKMEDRVGVSLDFPIDTYGMNKKRKNKRKRVAGEFSEEVVCSGHDMPVSNKKIKKDCYVKFLEKDGKQMTNACSSLAIYRNNTNKPLANLNQEEYTFYKNVPKELVVDKKGKKAHKSGTNSKAHELHTKIKEQQQDSNVQDNRFPPLLEFNAAEIQHGSLYSADEEKPIKRMKKKREKKETDFRDSSEIKVYPVAKKTGKNVKSSENLEEKNKLKKVKTDLDGAKISIRNTSWEDKARVEKKKRKEKGGRNAHDGIENEFNSYITKSQVKVESFGFNLLNDPVYTSAEKNKKIKKKREVDGEVTCNINLSSENEVTQKKKKKRKRERRDVPEGIVN